MIPCGCVGETDLTKCRISVHPDSSFYIFFKIIPYFYSGERHKRLQARICVQYHEHTLRQESQGAVLNLEHYFEKLGVRYFKHLYRKVKAEHYIHIEGLPSDKIIQVIVQNVTRTTLFIAFLTGALTTVPSVLIEIYYETALDTFHYYLLLGSVTLLMLVIELGILYWLGLHAVHTLASITGHCQLEPDPTIPVEYQVEQMLVRSALELPDPVIRYLGIDPMKNISQKRALIAGLLYKAKVILTSVILKLLLRRVAGRFGVRETTTTGKSFWMHCMPPERKSKSFCSRCLLSQPHLTERFQSVSAATFPWLSKIRHNTILIR